MSELSTDDARHRVAAAVGAIEKGTSAEVVVAMRQTSGHYRSADYAFGALAAVALLCLFLYHPAEFDFTFFPLEQAAAFVVGAALCAHLPPLRRLLSAPSVRRANVARAARAVFVDRGVTKTRARSGVLVYLSAFERDAEVVLDVGLDPAKLGASWVTACAELRAASARQSLGGLLSAMTALGKALAESYPAGDDDIDELPNEVAA